MAEGLLDGKDELVQGADSLSKDGSGVIGALMSPPTDDGSSCRGVHADGSLVQDWEYFDTFFKRYNKVLHAPVLGGCPRHIRLCNHTYIHTYRHCILPILDHDASTTMPRALCL